LITTAEYASSTLPFQLSSCGWKIEIFAPAGVARPRIADGRVGSSVCEKAGDALRDEKTAS